MAVAATSRWDEFRQLMPVSKKWAYFDHAAVAPIPQTAMEKISDWALQATQDGDAVWGQWNHLHEELRNLTARVINADAREIALVPNTTFGINLVAEGYPWTAGDNIVLPEHEFPSNVYPWMSLESRGVELRQVPLVDGRVCPNRMADACDAKTRIVSVSWVGYASGARLDPTELARVAHDAGALFFLDAIQGMGVFPLDVRESEIDFLAADGHKWLLGPEGAGVFYIRHELLNKLRPLNVGWNSVKQGNDFSNVDLQVRDAASRYEGGTQNMVGFIGLGASLQLLHDFGLGPNESEIGEQVLKVSGQLIDALTEAGGTVYSPRGEGVSSGIVSFDFRGQASKEMWHNLQERGVLVSFRGGRMRAATHCYNNENDTDRLIEGLKSVCSA